MKIDTSSIAFVEKERKILETINLAAREQGCYNKDPKWQGWMWRYRIKRRGGFFGTPICVFYLNLGQKSYNVEFQARNIPEKVAVAKSIATTLESSGLCSVTLRLNSLIEP